MKKLGKRIVIIGCSGSGKSTLATRLGELTGIPVIYLDSEFWNAGWVETPQDEWRAKVPALLKGDEWIADGHYNRTLDIRLKKADTVIVLDFNRFVCLYSAVKRLLQNLGRTRPDMAEGCPEKIDWEFVCWIWSFNRKERPVMMEKLAGFGGNIIILKNRRQVNEFIRKNADKESSLHD